MRIFILSVILYCATVLAIQAPDNKGTEFMLAFTPNYVHGEDSIYVSAEQTTSFEVRVPYLGMVSTFTVTGGTTLKVPISSNNIELISGIENKGISVKTLDATKEITVVGFNRYPATTDAYLALPIDVLSTEHVLASYNQAISGEPSNAAVIAHIDGTQVTVYPSNSASVGASNINFPNSQTFTLNRFQTLYITSTNDLTGTRIVSTQPVGVIAGVRCANVRLGEYACDYIVEWMAPVNTWANEYYTVPLATRLVGDVVRVVSNTDGNQIRANGALVATINKYQYYEGIFATPVKFVSSNPSLVMQYSRGSSADGVTSDPFQMWAPTASQYSSNYFITSLAGFSNWINIVIENGKQSGLSLDGAAISTTWITIPGTTYVGAKVAVAAGFHSIFHSSPIVPFGVFSYGWASYDSYGYPGGMRLAPLQDPCTVTVTVAGDGVDNDCDDRIDEELRNGIDDDGDGRIDEDLATPPPQTCCQTSQHGPIFTGTAADVSIQCHQALPAVPTISATVECPEQSTSVVTPVITTTQGNCVDSRTITRRWVSIDDCERSNAIVQTVTVSDTVGPSVVAPADKTVECGSTTYGDSAVASDLCAGTLAATFSDATSGNSCSSTITRTWTAVDNCGNTGSDTQVITVHDTTGPSTTASNFCVFPPNGQYKCFDVTDPDYVFGSDTCNNDLTVSFNNDCTNVETGDSTGCYFDAGYSRICVKATTDHVSDAHYTFSFNVADSCGNTVSQSVLITVPNSAEEAGSCVAPEDCFSECEDEQCAPTVIPFFVDDVQVGILYVRNKLNWEVSFEFMTFEGFVPDRGWWMTGLVASIGDKRIVKDFTFGNYQSRWFEALNAFPQRDVQCGATVDIFVAVQVTNDKRNANGVKHTVIIGGEASKRSFSLPSNLEEYTVPYTLCCECTMRTQTQNDYGNICNLQRTTDNARIRDIACYASEFYSWSAEWCFPSGITVGCSTGFTATWTSISSLQNYLADETSPHVLAQNYVDPARRTVGFLAAETAALSLNIKFDECDSEWSTSCTHLRDLTVCRHPTSESRTQCAPYYGMTVGQIFDTANSVVGGCSNGDVTTLFECVRYINREFVDGKRFWETPDFFPNAGCPGTNPQ